MVMSVGLKARSQNESAHQLERGEKTESRGPQNIEAPLLFCTWLAESSRFAGVGSPRCVHARLARERTLLGSPRRSIVCRNPLNSSPKQQQAVGILVQQLAQLLHRRVVDQVALLDRWWLPPRRLHGLLEGLRRLLVRDPHAKA